MARTIAKNHDEKRGRILATAAEVFARHGYDAASVSQVAQACSISKANIYHYYNRKEDILFDILETYLLELRDRINSLNFDGLSAEQQLRKTVQEILLTYMGSDNEHRVQVAGLDALPDDRREILQGYQREIVAHMASIIAAIAPDNVSGDRQKMRAATMSVFGMLNWHYMWSRNADEKARKDYADVVSGLVLGGISDI